MTLTSHMSLFSEREEYINGGCRFSSNCDGVRWYYDDDGCRSCECCGGVDPHYREFDRRPVYTRHDALSRRGKGTVTSWGVGRGRYKEKFHFNERIAQWSIRDPLIPSFDWAKIVSRAKSGQYGPIEDFTRSTIVTLTRNMGFQKYRERWKRILFDLTRKEMPVPEDELIEWMGMVFDRIVENFGEKKRLMPASLSTISHRHNFMSYNYTIIKLLEALGDYRFHWEFPLPRSHTKLHLLDDVFSIVASELDIPFTRSVVIKRGKFKKNKMNPGN